MQSWKVLVSLMGLILVTCSKSNMSDRDVRREQLRTSAETKRKELQVVEGEYQGLLTLATGVKQKMSLKLDIKDIPTAVDGEVDPVMTPVLAGFLRWNNNPFAIAKADFDPKRSRLDIVASDPVYKEIMMALTFANPILEGTWSGPAFADSGTVRLERKNLQQGEEGLAEQLRGEYGGVLLDDSKGLYQYAHLVVSTSIQPPATLKVSATLKIIFGAWDSVEYLTYRFDPVSFNPVTGQIIIKGDASDVSFTGTWANEKLSGEWFSDYVGKMGAMHFEKNFVASPVIGRDLAEALKGTYRGTIKNTNPQSNLPERILISFVTSQDLSQPNGLKVSGNVRFYVGEFGSIEYVEMALSNIQYNFFTRKLVAKTTGAYNFTLIAGTDQKKINGTLHADSLGEVAQVEVTKE
ncbi:MAG: hypothetical protein HY537_13325 [Deltaproteobacteria bacterium]|nr:hypothetical protein [Deltaproteobacteria bacterium]